MAARQRRADVGVVDRRAHRDRARAPRPRGDPADPLDAEPADPCARDEGDPAALQGRPSKAVGRAHEVLQGEQDQPVRVLSPDRLPDPDLHLALLRSSRLREGDLPAVPGVVARVARTRGHHRADQGRLGARAHRGLRHKPADLDLPHVDVDAEQGAALHDHVPPDRLPPVHPRLPLRADDLLAHHEPVDDGTGARDASTHAQAGRSAKTLEPHAAEGSRGVGERRGLE